MVILWDFMGFYGDLMVILWRFSDSMEFYGDLMGCYADFMGFYGDLMVILLWDFMVI